MKAVERLLSLLVWTMSWEAAAATKLPNSWLLDRISSPLRKNDENQQVRLGMFAVADLRGTWQSSKAGIWDFIKGTQGMMELAFGANYAQNDTNLFIWLGLYEGEFYDTRAVGVVVNMTVTRARQRLSVQSFNETIAQQGLIFQKKLENCTLDIFVSIQDSLKNQVPLTSNDPFDLSVTGTLTSKDCNIDLSFSAKPWYINLKLAIAFLLLMSVSASLKALPFIRAVFQHRIELSCIVSEYTMFALLILDLLETMHIYFLSMIWASEYYQFLAVIMTINFAGIMAKILFIIKLSEFRIETLNMSREERHKSISIIFIKVVCIFMIMFFVAYFTLGLSWIYLLFLLLPLLQVAHNCSSVIKKQCFIPKLHPSVFGTPYIFPFLLHGLFSKIFNFQPSTFLSVSTAVLATLALLAMCLQRALGPNFFIPKRWRPHHFDYFQKVKDSEEVLSDCAICLTSVSVLPPTDGNEEPLLAKVFMETPCSHRFHKECLIKWMSQRLLCPCCRAPIPPY